MDATQLCLAALTLSLVLPVTRGFVLDTLWVSLRPAYLTLAAAVQAVFLWASFGRPRWPRAGLIGV